MISRDPQLARLCLFHDPVPVQFVRAGGSSAPPAEFSRALPSTSVNVPGIWSLVVEDKTQRKVFRHSGTKEVFHLTSYMFY
jgi:hypothetical protein